MSGKLRLLGAYSEGRWRPVYGVAASGEPVEINGTAILRIRNGKIVEHWGGPHCQDGVGLTH